MRISDRQFLTLKRLQILSGVVPVGLFLFSHFAINGQAIAGRSAYQSAAAALGRLPWLTALEIAAIGVPLALHLTLGALLGLTRQGSRDPAHPGPAERWVLRASGLYLAMFVVCHVWAIRLSPDRHSEADLFDLVASQLRHPALFALNALAVVAAGAHFAIGCLALFGPNAFTLPRAGAGFVRAIGVAGFVLLTGVGLNALLAFVWAPARWLAPH